MTRFATKVIVLAVDVGEDLVDDEDDDVSANEFGKHPFSTGRHPLRRACRTVWLAISSDTPEALS